MNSIVEAVKTKLNEALNELEQSKKAGGLTAIYEVGDSNERSVPLRCAIKNALQSLDQVDGFSIQYEGYYDNAPQCNSRMYLIHENLPNVRFKLLSYKGRLSPYYLNQPKLKRSPEQLSLLDKNCKSNVQAMIFIHCNREDAQGFFFWSVDENNCKYKLTDEQSFTSLIEQVIVPQVESPSPLKLSIKEII